MACLCNGGNSTFTMRISGSSITVLCMAGLGMLRTGCPGRLARPAPSAMAGVDLDTATVVGRQHVFDGICATHAGRIHNYVLIEMNGTHSALYHNDIQRLHGRIADALNRQKHSQVYTHIRTHTYTHNNTFATIAHKHNNTISQ